MAGGPWRVASGPAPARQGPSRAGAGRRASRTSCSRAQGSVGAANIVGGLVGRPATVALVGEAVEALLAASWAGAAVQGCGPGVLPNMAAVSGQERRIGAGNRLLGQVNPH